MAAGGTPAAPRVWRAEDAGEPWGTTHGEQGLRAEKAWRRRTCLGQTSSTTSGERPGTQRFTLTTPTTPSSPQAETHTTFEARRQATGATQTTQARGPLGSVPPAAGQHMAMHLFR